MIQAYSYYLEYKKATVKEQKMKSKVHFIDKNIHFVD